MSSTMILKNAKRVQEALGSRSRADELRWYGQELRLDDAALLRLLGYTPAEIRRHAGTDFVTLANARPDQTIWVTELFRGMIHWAGYDLTALAETLHEPTDKLKRDGSDLSPEELLNAIATGGPNVYRLLEMYLRRSYETSYAARK